MAGLGQSPCASKCPPTVYAPISGRVTDAVDGHPLAGALVSYQGRGDGFPSMGSTVALNPPSIEGSVRTDSDGSYTLPLLPQGGFEVRASEAGYLSSQEFLRELPVGWHRDPRSLPIPGCAVDCTIALPDETFKLQPDVLELRPMSSGARAKFVLPGDNPGLHWINTIAFSQDGTHAAFITQDSFAVGGEQSCVGWNYDLSTGQLIRTAEELPAKYCEPLVVLAWNGDAVYAFNPWNLGFNLHLADGDVMRWQGAEATTLRAQDVPNEIQQDMQRRYQMLRSDGNAETDDAEVEGTADGQYQLISGPGAGRQCNSLTIASKQGDWKQLVSGCGGARDYILDRNHDFLVLYEPRRLAQDEPPFQKLTLFDLKTRSRRSFLIPETNSILQLLAEQRLADGTTRVAYSIEGDCDPAGPDAAHTPAFGEPPNRNKPRNLCFVRIPAK